MKKIILLILISFAAQSQTLVKTKQIGDGLGTGSVVVSGGINGSLTYSATTSLPFIPTSSVSAFVPYSGATTNVNLGSYSLAAGSQSLSGNLEINQGGILIYGFQPLTTATTLPAHYLGIPLASRNGTNYFSISDGSANAINAPDNLVLKSGGVNAISIQSAPASGNPQYFLFYNLSSSGNSTTSAIQTYNFGGATTGYGSGGTLPLQLGSIFGTNTYTSSGSLTIPKAVGVKIEAPTAGTGATITTNLALEAVGNISVTGTSSLSQMQARNIAIGNIELPNNGQGAIINRPSANTIPFLNFIKSVAGTTALYMETEANGSGLIVGNNTTTSATLEVAGTLSVTGAATVTGAMRAQSNLSVTGTFSAGGATTITGALTGASSIQSTSKTAGVGYAVGSGSTVTQATSRTTGVTINAVTGSITLFSTAGSTSYQSFTVTNSAVTAKDLIIVNQQTGTDLYEVFITAVAAGSFRVSFATTGGTTVEAPVFNFAVIKGQTN